MAERLGREGKVLADLGNELYLERWPITGLREQELNANVMPPSIFQRLVENVRKRGELESVPFCALVDGKVEIVSGHHRVRAARAADLSEVTILVDRSGLSRSAIVAKQLAHNALAGSDDPEILSQLLARIETPDDLLESGVDLSMVNGIGEEDVSLFAPHVDFEFRTLMLSFLPHQMSEFQELLDRVDRKVELTGAVPAEQFREFIDAASRYAKLRDIRNAGAAVALLTRIALSELEAEP